MTSKLRKVSWRWSNAVADYWCWSRLFAFQSASVRMQFLTFWGVIMKWIVDAIQLCLFQLTLSFQLFTR